MRENAYLTKKKLGIIKNKMEKELDRVSISQLSEEGGVRKEELSDQVDEANSNIQVSHDLRMKNRELFYFKKLQTSLTRLNEITFGLCKECDAEIGFERLMARPTAELCINCKEESEFQENNNFFDRRSKSLGKTLQEISAN